MNNYPGIKYLNKVNELFDNFNQFIKQNNTKDAYNILKNIRIIDGKLIHTFNLLLSACANNNCNDKYFEISCTQSIISAISKIIENAEKIFAKHINDNNINQDMLNKNSENPVSIPVNKIDILNKLKNLKNNEDKQKKNNINVPNKNDIFKKMIDMQNEQYIGGNELPLFNGKKINSELDDELLKLFNNQNGFDKNLPLLLFFYNPGCPACVKTKPEWEKFSNNMINSQKKSNEKIFNIMDVNLSDKQNVKLAELLNIEYIPTIIMTEPLKKQNKKIERKTGTSSYLDIIDFVKNSYNNFNKL
jgi:thiol-disulfide isomerase/thioredoxin